MDLTEKIKEEYPDAKEWEIEEIVALLQSKGGEKMKLNKMRLNPARGKDYAEMVFWGDVHYGSSYCDVRRATAMLDYCLKNNVYVFCMGDVIEAATRYSVGSGVYEQLSPNKQIEWVIETLGPLAKKGLIAGFLSGNHEDRIMKETGVDIAHIITRELKVPYLGPAGWSLFYVGDQSYTVYAIHGATGSKFAHSKLKAASDIAYHFQADVLAHAHVHDIVINSMEKQIVDKARKVVATQKCHVIVTGHYLEYYGSYAQMKGLPPGKMGSPKAKFHANKFDIHVSV